MLEKTDQEKNSAEGAPDELGCHGMRKIESHFHGIPMTLHNRGPPDNYDRRWNIPPGDVCRCPGGSRAYIRRQ